MKWISHFSSKEGDRVRILAGPPVRNNTSQTELIMTPRLREILVIAQEEAAEVIQEIAKCFRFGIDKDNASGILHRETLQNEIADFLVMVDLLRQEGIIDDVAIQAAKLRKIKKLQVWSDIYR